MLLDSGKVEFNTLAKLMEVSHRTIFREIASINDMLKERQIKISVKKSDLVLHATQKQVEELKQIMGDTPKRLLLTPKQRTLFITAQLLLADTPYKSAFFSYQLNVAEATISLYVDNIEHWLEGKNLTLNRKRRYGIKIEGSDWNKRNALVTLIYEYKPVEELLPYIYETKKDPVLHSFFRLLFGDRILKLSKEITNLLPEGKIDDVPYLTFLFHTMISLRKTIDGHPITLPDEFIREAVSANSFHFAEKLKQFLQSQNIPVKESEIAYISIHLPTSFLYGANQKSAGLDVTMNSLAEEVLYETGKILGTNINKDSQLISSLSNYFSLAIFRINMGIQIKNSLLNQIQEHYETLFKAVENACKLVFSKYNIRLSLDEIGFITMNIGATLETRERFNNNISILIVCPNGLFASRILRNKVQNVIRDIDHIDIASLKDWAETNGAKYDLILSTVELDHPQKHENVLVVSPFLSDDDIAKIHNHIAMIRKQHADKNETRVPPNRSAFVQSNEVALIDQMVKNLWLETIPAEPFQSIIERISFGLYRRGITLNWQKVCTLIAKREKIGSVVIPGTRVSLLHIRSDAVLHPFIGIYRLSGEIIMKGTGFVQEPVDTYLLMLARSSENSIVLEKMGNISIHLIEDKSFTEKLRKSNLEQLRNIFDNLLKETKEER
jgi:mannitol operon transcriptional antiterminator